LTSPPITPTPPAISKWKASSLNRSFSRTRTARCQWRRKKSWRSSRNFLFVRSATTKRYVNCRIFPERESLFPAPTNHTGRLACREVLSLDGKKIARAWRVLRGVRGLSEAERFLQPRRHRGRAEATARELSPLARLIHTLCEEKIRSQIVGMSGAILQRVPATTLDTELWIDLPPCCFRKPGLKLISPQFFHCFGSLLIRIRFQQRAFQPRKILFDFLSQIFAIKSHSRVITGNVLTSLLLDDSPACFVDAV